MKTISTLLIAALLALAACGDDDPGGSAAPPPQEETGVENDGGGMRGERPARNEGRATAAGKGTAVTVADSEFGPMLFGANRRAIYIFENDPKGRTVCQGECAEAWPPVLTKGEPRAAKGVKQSLLGTTRRPDGSLQVTYAGKPLYFYAHEGPGEVRCHNVDLNGGLWWVVGPDGKRRP